MRSTARDILWRTAKYLAVASILIGVNEFGYQTGLRVAKDQVVRGWPNLPDCQSTAVARYPSDDGAYLATIFETILRRRRICQIFP